MTDSNAPALTERDRNMQAVVAQPLRTTSTSRKRRASQQKMGDTAEKVEDKNAILPIADKENVLSLGEQDDITALPIKWRLDHSPHLRPVDSEKSKAQIPYDFQNATSQSSVQRTDGASSSKPGTLRSKRSTFDGSSSVKRRSSKKRKDEHLREEEIREMSTTSSPQAKRVGDGARHRESFKRRSFVSKKASAVSLPPIDPTTISSPPGVVEQHGWEIREFWVNPRPPIRLSKVPAYTWNSPSQNQLPLARNISQKVREKMPKRDESSRRHRTIGAAADDLDSSDLRVVLERDAKRKQERERRKQERLDRKLRATGRTRSSSEISRLGDLEKEKATEAATLSAVAASQQPESSKAPSTIHPAFRDEPVISDKEVLGLGIGTTVAAAAASRHAHHHDADEENPFMTPAETATGSGGYATPREQDEGPFEDPVVGTAREVRLSIATTPPLSPVDRSRRLSARIPDEALTPTSPALVSPPQSPTHADTAQAMPVAAVAAAPVAAVDTSAQRGRVGSQSRDRRSGAWASFFKRTGTQKDPKAPEMSFANTSRESMGRQHQQQQAQQQKQLPPHLLTDRESPFPKRSKSGPPTRTQSRFREDLPDAPLSPPPESRLQSPVSEMPDNAAAIAASYAASPNRTHRSSVSAAIGATGRSDTPVSPIRSPDVMAASLASVDSEASWLASGGSIKRASVQSGAGKSLASYKRHTSDFNASYEDLGGSNDKDADYVQRGTASRQSHHLSEPAVAGATREAEDDETAVQTALPVHGSVRRKPTLIHHDPAIRSREGLLSEYSAGDGPSGSAVQDDSTDDSDFADGSARLEKARSIDYGKGHARQVSAGSAKLFDVAPSKRHSGTPATPTMPPAGFNKTLVEEDE